MSGRIALTGQTNDDRAARAMPVVTAAGGRRTASAPARTTNTPHPAARAANAGRSDHCIGTFDPAATSARAIACAPDTERHAVTQKRMRKNLFRTAASANPARVSTTIETSPGSQTCAYPRRSWTSPISAVATDATVDKPTATENNANATSTPITFAQKNNGRDTSRASAAAAVPEDSSPPITRTADAVANTIPKTRSAEKPHSLGRRPASPNWWQWKAGNRGTAMSATRKRTADSGSANASNVAERTSDRNRRMARRPTSG